MELLKLLITVLFTVTSTAVSYANMKETADSHINPVDLQRQGNDIHRGVKRSQTYPSYVLEAWIEETNLYIISYTDMENVVIKIKDIDGNMIYENEMDIFADEEVSINLSTLAHGNYIICIYISGIEFRGMFDY